MSYIKGIKWNYYLVKEFVNNLGYELINNTDDIFNTKSILYLKDKYGYLYTTNISNLNLGQKIKMVGKSNIYSIYNIKLYLKLNNIPLELLDNKYINTKFKLTFKDPSNYYYQSTWNSVQQGRLPRMVDKNNKYSIYNIKLFLKNNNIDLELLSNKYITNITKLILKDKFGYYYTSLWCNLQIKHTPFFVDIHNEFTINNLKLWCILNNKKYTLLSKKYKGAFNKLKFRCNICNKIFYMMWSNLQRDRGCPYCSQSKGEKKTSEQLHVNSFTRIIQEQYDKLNYNDKYINNYFIPQKKFDGLVGLKGGKLSYDFYIPKFNLLIEYQGEQHERYIPGFHKSKEDFLKQIEHDKRKKEYAENNNIKLLEIWYWEFDNIEQILIKELNLLSKVS